MNGAVQSGCERIWSKDLNPGQVYDRVIMVTPSLSMLLESSCSLNSKNLGSEIKPMFPINDQLLTKAHGILSGRDNIYWLIGGSCTGKSTMCRAISEKTGIPVYDMDQHIFGRYMKRYDPDRHPASTAWFAATNPLAWALSLSWPDFDALYKAANAEYLDLLADDLAGKGRAEPLLIDGGITHPSVLTQVIPLDQIFCLDASDAERVAVWEQSESRAEMKRWIFELPEPEEKWATFLQFDHLINQTIVKESRDSGIRVFFRDQSLTADNLAQVIGDHFKLRAYFPTIYR